MQQTLDPILYRESGDAPFELDRPRYMLDELAAAYHNRRSMDARVRGANPGSTSPLTLDYYTTQLRIDTAARHAGRVPVFATFTGELVRSGRAPELFREIVAGMGAVVLRDPVDPDDADPVRLLIHDHDLSVLVAEIELWRRSWIVKEAAPFAEQRPHNDS